MSSLESGPVYRVYRGRKNPKNKLYTRYTQEQGQVKLSKKEVMI